MGKSKYTIEQKMEAIYQILITDDIINHMATLIGVDSKALELIICNWIDGLVRNKAISSI